ncbi:hypothetical protein GCM10018781_15660 [Kitasatospora indigofera]|uniref:Uncharacterized protein n=1 Tax=Kitasatospora indigofera TaxID=67307 RepID=A0A919KMS9_9ACTN|nr:hypothetical protein [Kitasatospora indigofera]GHH64476.1 hypothetical protein GCM10018781_15660 [Kitasatospora indigofera]
MTDPGEQLETEVATLVLAVLAFAVAIGGGLLVACNVGGSAERIFDVLDGFSLVSGATPRTVRIIGGGFAALATVGIFVVALSRAQGH